MGRAHIVCRTHDADIFRIIRTAEILTSKQISNQADQESGDRGKGSMNLNEIGNRARAWVSSVTRPADVESVMGTLLAPVTSVLMIFDDQLVNLADGRAVALAAAPDTSTESDAQRSPVVTASAAHIATAAGRLLSGALAGRSAEQPLSVLLLLPTAECLFSAASLPGVAPQAVRSALALQSVGLLPAYEEELTVAVNVQQPDVVAWLPAARVDELFEAFAQSNLFLAGVQPRPLFLARQLHAEHPQQAVCVYDQDAEQVAALMMRNEALVAASQSARHDLENPQFADQWQQQTAACDEDAVRLILDSPQGYLDWVEPRFHDLLKRLNASYLFVPSGALAARHRFNKGKLRGTLAGVAAGLLLVCCLPFLVQTVRLWTLEAELATLTEQSAPAREDQAVVRDFESQWGMVSEFPRQDVPQVMLALQDILNPSVLTALEINEGRVSIEGESPDPQNLLEMLERNALFTEVDFARATNNNRYYIDLRLTTANFPAYHAWHFPERR